MAQLSDDIRLKSQASAEYPGPHHSGMEVGRGDSGASSSGLPLRK